MTYPLEERDDRFKQVHLNLKSRHEMTVNCHEITQSKDMRFVVKIHDTTNITMFKTASEHYLETYCYSSTEVYFFTNSLIDFGF